MTERHKLTPPCACMLRAVRAAGECVRYVNHQGWEVGEQRFAAQTGDALARRGLLRHIVREHDGNHYDRYVPAADGEEADAVEQSTRDTGGQ